MKIVFILIIILGFFYFFLKKRKVDFLTIAFISASVYFFPGIMGYVIEPQLLLGVIELVKVPLVGETYLVMILFFILLIITAIINDKIIKGKMSNSLFNKRILESHYILMIYTIISLSAFVYLLISTNFSIFVGKNKVWEGLGITSIMLTLSTSFIFITSYINKNKKLFIYSILLIIILFLVGNRSILVIALLSIFLYKFNNYGKIKLIHYVKLKLLILVSMSAILIFMGKDIYGTFHREGPLKAIQILFKFELYEERILESEPFFIQNILNTVLLNDYTIGIESLKTLHYHIVIAPSFFGRDTSSFTADFKEAFYPFVEYGMAYNIWAESIAVGGWLFLLITLILFCLSLITFNLLIQCKDNFLKAMFILMGIYVAFYIHRNSIDTIITFERHLVYIYLISLFLSYLLYMIFKKNRMNKG